MGVSLAYARVGAFRTTLALGATLTLRTALRHAPCPSRKLYFDVLPCLYIYPCFIFFNAHYQSLTKLKNFLPCLNCTCFILIFKYLKD
ncbi:MAG: hypothetical protein NZ455_14635 [Bacteroidia bacterium]|nr:hypothetical protein [Bacteroidia bacterium]MDW8346313.1 hypothetical protein [Bacteroidia bacterium]